MIARQEGSRVGIVRLEYYLHTMVELLWEMMKRYLELPFS